MKKLILIALIASIAIPTVVFTSAADNTPTPTAAQAAQQAQDAYQIDIAGNTLSFLRAGKMVSSYPLQNTNIMLVQSKAGGIAVQFTDNDGNVQRITCGAQQNLVVTGKADSLTLDASLPKTASVEVARDASFGTVKIHAPVSVNVLGTVKNLQVTHKSASVTSDAQAKITSVKTVSYAAVKNVSADAISLGTGKETANYSESTKSSGSKKSDREETGSSSSSSTADTKPVRIAIDAVESVRNGLVRVTLNRATDQMLTQNAFSILCTGGGKDMTILRVSSVDNRVYDLSTAYYNDNTYNLMIYLPDGTQIDRDFISKFDCPQLSSLNAVRVSETEADFAYVSDAPGDFYYLLQPDASARSRAANQEPTTDELIAGGQRLTMKQGDNLVRITDLQKDAGYRLYFCAKDTEGRVTPVKSDSIPGEVSEQNPGVGDMAIESFRGYASDRFVLKFTKPTSTKLDISAFKVICPSSGTLSLGRAETTDNQTYTLYMEPNTFYFSGNTQKVTVTFPDGGTVSGSFYVDVQAPNLSLYEMEWIDEDTVEIVVRSDEAGILYFKQIETVDQSSKPKPPDEIYKTGEQVRISYGTNYIRLTGAKAGWYFCCAPEDQYGNRNVYMHHKEIPAYTEPEKPEENTPTITGIDYMPPTGGRPSLTVTFSQPVSLSNRDVNVGGLLGRPMWSTYAANTEKTKWIMELQNYTVGSGPSDCYFLPGTHVFTLATTINGKPVEIRGNFTVPDESKSAAEPPPIPAETETVPEMTENPANTDHAESSQEEPETSSVPEQNTLPGAEETQSSSLSDADVNTEMSSSGAAGE